MNGSSCGHEKKWAQQEARGESIGRCVLRTRPPIFENAGSSADAAETKATEAAAPAAWIAARREKAAAADEAGGGVVGTDSAIEHTQRDSIGVWKRGVLEATGDAFSDAQTRPRQRHNAPASAS